MYPSLISVYSQTKVRALVSITLRRISLSTNLLSKNRTARDFINDRLLVNAKEYLNDDLLTVNQISTKLGFEYPQHFVRFFKQHTGKTPSEYRNTV